MRICSVSLLGLLAKCSIGLVIPFFCSEMAEEAANEQMSLQDFFESAVENTKDQPDANEAPPTGDVPEASQDATWDEGVEDPEGDAIDDDGIAVPDVLRRLEESGVSFTAAHKLGFIGDGLRTVLNKNLYVYFTVDSVVSSQDILFGFDRAELIEEVTCIQRKGSNRS